MSGQSQEIKTYKGKERREEESQNAFFQLDVFHDKIKVERFLLRKVSNQSASGSDHNGAI